MFIMAIYNPKSLKAEEFINHEEILDTIRYAQENKHNVALVLRRPTTAPSAPA